MIPATTTANRDAAMLVVIDVQERLSAAMSARESVLARTRLLLAVASIVGLPVVITRQYPKGLGDIEHVLRDAAEHDGSAAAMVDKMSFDCFAEPAFCDAVAARGRSQMILCGMESHICVTQTALAALREGFDVHIAADACCSRERENHDLAILRLTSAGAVISTAESVAYELVGRAGTEEFKALLSHVKG